MILTLAAGVSLCCLPGFYHKSREVTWSHSSSTRGLIPPAHAWEMTDRGQCATMWCVRAEGTSGFGVKWTMSA